MGWVRDGFENKNIDPPRTHLYLKILSLAMNASVHHIKYLPADDMSHV